MNRHNLRTLGLLGATVIVAIAIVCTGGGSRIARAASTPLALDIYTADAQGIGVTSTLVYGDTEAILVDTQFRISDAEKLADRIAGKGRRLKAILVTHPHFDHFYGASVLLRRFPGTPVYASASDIEYIKGDLANTVAQIRTTEEWQSRPRTPSDASTLIGKHLMGYQNWFGAPNNNHNNN